MTMNARNLPLLLGMFYRMARRRPTFISYNVTDRCSERCMMCTVWREPRKELALDEMRGILANLRQFGLRVVEVTGGEPFLRRDIFDIFAVLDKLGYLYTCTSNGLHFDPATIESLRTPRNLLQLGVSVDSLDRKLYEQLRGKDLLPVVLENLERLSAARLSIPVKINFTMSRLNYRETYAMVDYARNHGMYLSVFPVNLGSGMQHRHTDDMLQAKENERREMAALFTELARMKRRQRAPLWEYSRFYELAADYVLGKPLGPCDAGGLYLDLHADGRLAVCLDQEEFADLCREDVYEAMQRLSSQTERIRKCHQTTPCCYTCTYNLSLTARHIPGFLWESAIMFLRSRRATATDGFHLPTHGAK